MGNQFEWQVDESPDQRPSPDESCRSRAGTRNFLITASLITIVIIGGWALLRQQQERNTHTLVESTQSTVDLMQAAVSSGDGELFFALQDGGSELFAAQLLPHNLDFYRAGPIISNVEQIDSLLHANAVWQENGQLYQRVLFFSRQGNQASQVAANPAYWGEAKQAQQAWGRLVYHQADIPWAVAITDFVTAEVENLCASDCLSDNLPVTLEIRPDFQQTAEPGHLFVSSPRLLGLDESGQPSDRFWQTLEQHLADYLTPAIIRFAVPPDHKQVYELDNLRSIHPDKLQRFEYEAAAAAFMAERPDIRVELLPMESMPQSPQELAHIDGAAFVPTIEMIAGGQVRDLTPYVLSDPDFDRDDFYEQIWQGATWEDRLWIMPQAARIPLMFYHRDAYQALGFDQPLIGWTWSEMRDDAARLPAAEIVTGDTLQWGYLDQTFNTLFSYALNNQGHCGSLEKQRCPLPLSNEDIAAALEWTVHLAVEEEIMPDLSLMTVEERQRLLINSLFKTAIWVDEAIYYEHRTLMFPMGVLPFPGSERFEGSTPLWVTGSFISQQSERPLATWQWLKFLSEWPPMPRYRLIPARPSVSQETNYWSGLPRALEEPMRSAFPLARPVQLADRDIFSWPAIRPVMQGQVSALEAAQEARDFSWFGD